MRIALVACSKTKAPSARAARELYTSPLFRKSRMWAERFADRWAILSARHGLVLPETILEPYDEELPSFPRARYEIWRRETGEAIGREFGVLDRGDSLVFLSSEAYANCSTFVPGSPRREQPIRTLQVGERLAWLNAQLALPGATSTRASSRAEPS